MPPYPLSAAVQHAAVTPSARDRHRLLAVIPALNEAASVGAVVDQVRSILAVPVLVVSDSSTDRTAEAARESGAQVIELTERIGAWGATQTGIRHAVRRGYSAVVTLDADGQHDPSCLASLVEAYERTGADIVIGTFPQRLSSAKRLAWAWFRALTGLGVEDLTSGLRLYGPRALPILASAEATLLDYQDVGVLLLLRKYGLTVHEVPVTMHPRRDGHSRVFASWLTVARYMAQTTLLCVARVGRFGRAPAVRFVPR
jgi:glycosyltransferase involved in cell wall biosynthesis